MTKRLAKVDNDSSREEEHSSLSNALVALQDPTGAASEAYRMLRTNLIYIQVDTPPKVIVLTSVGRNEGKSITTANLGVTLAQAGKNTLILDCDLRKPEQHRIFGTRSTGGLIDVLVGEQDPQEVWQEPIPRLKLIAAGAPPPNPAEMLTSLRFADFLGQMKQKFDYVLIDTPPVGYASESAALAAIGDGVLLVLDCKHTRKVSLRQALRRLENVGANVLGTIMNKYDAPKGRTTDDGYYPLVPTDY